MDALGRDVPAAADRFEGLERAEPALAQAIEREPAAIRAADLGQLLDSEIFGQALQLHPPTIPRRGVGYDRGPTRIRGDGLADDRLDGVSWARADGIPGSNRMAKSPLLPILQPEPPRKSAVEKYGGLLYLGRPAGSWRSRR